MAMAEKRDGAPVLVSRNPATGETIEEVAEFSPREIETALADAEAAWRDWRLSDFDTRAAMLNAAADHLDKEQERLARLATQEMGKRIAEARAEVEKCAWVCRYYAENGAAFLADRAIKTEKKESYVAYQPIGPVLAVMPWNFPYWQLFRFAAPALMAGNAALLKHASNVPLCSRAIEDVFTAAGAPRGLFKSLMISSGPVGDIIADSRVRAVTLTGSTAAGAKVASQAARHIKKAVLELGGSDPFIVMPSADLDKAVATAQTARLINNGQSCIAAKRFIVHKDIYDEFAEKFAARLKAVTMGDPMDEDTGLGPLATVAIRDELADQVARSVKAGASVLAGGETPEGDGSYYPATVLADVPEGSPAAEEELFGPVASLFRVEDIDAAIALANSSEFGLGSSAWTNDDGERARFVRDLESGCVFVNSMVASDPRLPFGGVKESGFGRELGEHGIHEFVNIKTVAVA